MRDDNRLQINLFTDCGASQKACNEQEVIAAATFTQNTNQATSFCYSIKLQPPARLFEEFSSIIVHEIVWLNPQSADFTDIDL